MCAFLVLNCSMDDPSLSVFVMLFVYFGIMSVLSIYETVATPLNMDEFDWDAQTVCSLM